MAKPPDLPQQTHPDLTPSQPEIFFVPLMEPFAPLTEAKPSEEEQETKTGESAKSKCPFTCPLCGILSGPLCSWLWKPTHEETGPLEPQQVYGSYDLSDLIPEAVGNNVRVGPSKHKQAQGLIQYIESNVRSHGGNCNIEYNPEMNSFVIRADEETQQQVSKLLERIRLAMPDERGTEEASSEPMVVKPLEPALVAMGHDLTDLLSGRDADEVVRELVRVIETTIAPRSWTNRGGAGQLYYNPELKTLFIVQTEDVQEAIRELVNLKRSERPVRKSRGWEFADSGYTVDCLLEKAHGYLLAGRVEQAQSLVREAGPGSRSRPRPSARLQDAVAPSGSR